MFAQWSLHDGPLPGEKYPSKLIITMTKVRWEEFLTKTSGLPPLKNNRRVPILVELTSNRPPMASWSLS